MRGTGRRETGRKGGGKYTGGGSRGARSGISKVAGSGREREKLRNIAQYFVVEKAQRGGSQ